MSKQADLEKQLVELKKSKEYLLSRTADCMNLPDSKKAQVYNEVMPMLKAMIEAKINTGVWDMRENQTNLFNKFLDAGFGTDAKNHLEKV